MYLPIIVGIIFVALAVFAVIKLNNGRYRRRKR